MRNLWLRELGVHKEDSRTDAHGSSSSSVAVVAKAFKGYKSSPVVVEVFRNSRGDLSMKSCSCEVAKNSSLAMAPINGSRGTSKASVVAS